MSGSPEKAFRSQQGHPRRLGKNSNGYFGERIQLEAVLRDCLGTAKQHGWTVEHLTAEPAPDLVAFHRPGHPGALRVYVSTGIHGDEPAGPLAALELLRRNRWPDGLELRLCPCLNPAGFALGRRENREGTDLNRDYLHPTAPETIAHIRWLERQPSFDLCLCLHEDWESHGFYLYELNPENRPSLAEAMIRAVETICPVDHSEIIEGRPATNGIIRPSADPRSRPQWPEAFYLLTYKTRLSYTLEAPSDFPLQARVDALVAAVETAVAGAVGRGPHPEPHRS